MADVFPGPTPGLGSRGGSERTLFVRQRSATEDAWRRSTPVMNVSTASSSGSGTAAVRRRRAEQQGAGVGQVAARQALSGPAFVSTASSKPTSWPSSNGQWIHRSSPAPYQSDVREKQQHLPKVLASRLGGWRPSRAVGKGPGALTPSATAPDLCPLKSRFRAGRGAEEELEGRIKALEGIFAVQQDNIPTSVYMSPRIAELAKPRIVLPPPGLEFREMKPPEALLKKKDRRAPYIPMSPKERSSLSGSAAPLLSSGDPLMDDLDRILNKQNKPRTPEAKPRTPDASRRLSSKGSLDKPGESSPSSKPKSVTMQAASPGSEDSTSKKDGKPSVADTPSPTKPSAAAMPEAAASPGAATAATPTKPSATATPGAAASPGTAVAADSKPAAGPVGLEQAVANAAALRAEDDVAEEPWEKNGDFAGKATESPAEPAEPEADNSKDAEEAPGPAAVDSPSATRAKSSGGLSNSYASDFDDVSRQPTAEQIGADRPVSPDFEASQSEDVFEASRTTTGPLAGAKEGAGSAAGTPAGARTAKSYEDDFEQSGEVKMENKEGELDVKKGATGEQKDAKDPQPDTKALKEAYGELGISDEKQLVQAATRIQANVRGKQTRKKVSGKKKAETVGIGGSPGKIATVTGSMNAVAEEEESDEEDEESEAEDLAKSSSKMTAGGKSSSQMSVEYEEDFAEDEDDQGAKKSPSAGLNKSPSAGSNKGIIESPSAGSNKLDKFDEDEEFSERFDEESNVSQVTKTTNGSELKKQ